MDICAALLAEISRRILKRLFYPVIWQSHRRGAERSYAETRESPRHGFERMRLSVGEIRSPAAVDMYVDKAGQDNASGKIVLLPAV